MSEIPPVAKYKYTATITGNSHAEIMQELLMLARGGYLLDSDYETRDWFNAYSGRMHSELTHMNPEMTAERYSEELSAWFKRDRATQ